MVRPSDDPAGPRAAGDAVAAHVFRCPPEARLGGLRKHSTSEIPANPQDAPIRFQKSGGFCGRDGPTNMADRRYKTVCPARALATKSVRATAVPSPPPS